MSVLRHLFLATAFALAPFTAHAGECSAGGLAAAKPVAFAVTDVDTAQALSMTVIVGMTHEMKNHHLGLKLADPRCPEISVAIGSRRYVVLANDTSAWPRIAGENYDAILVATLRPEAAARLVRGVTSARSAGGPALTRVAAADVIYMLAGRAADRDHWSVFGFYDAIPDTPRLAQAMCQAALGSLPVVATYDNKTQGVSFVDLTALAGFSGGRADGPCTLAPA